MPPIAVPNGQCAIFGSLPFGGLDGGTPPQPRGLGNLSATVSDYTHFFVAQDAFAHVGVYARSGAVGQGQTLPVTITFNGTDVVGNPLPPVSVDFAFSGPPTPPLAVVLNIPAPVVQAPSGGAAPADPGSQTIQLPHN